MRQLRVGVVGLGLGRHHVAACAQAEHVGRLVICDPDTNRLEGIRAEFPRVAAAYESAAGMLSAERLDAVPESADFA